MQPGIQAKMTPSDLDPFPEAPAALKIGNAEIGLFKKTASRKGGLISFAGRG
jgi:hypothetical protein